MRILVVEDDIKVSAFISKGLHEAGYTVDSVTDGKDGLMLATTEPYELLIVDRMLPGIDGLTLIQTVRASDNKVPVIILSALGEVDDRVTGLHAGSDDYLVKPFAFSELLARIEALIRRASNVGKQETKIMVENLEMNLLSHEVHRNGIKISLQPREYEILKYLMEHKGQVVTRTMLLEHVWEYNFDPQTNVIDVQISRLRTKIDKDYDKKLINTIRGIGYKVG